MPTSTHEHVRVRAGFIMISDSVAVRYIDAVMVPVRVTDRVTIRVIGFRVQVGGVGGGGAFFRCG